MHWVGQLNSTIDSAIESHGRFKNPTDLTEKFSLHDYSKYEEAANGTD